MEEPRVLPAVAVNDDLTKAVSSALDPSEIRAAIIAEAEKQGLAADQNAADQKAAEKKIAEEKAAADAAATVPENFTRTEVIGGKEFTFDAATELELERLVNNAYKVAHAIQQTPPAPQVEPPVPQPTAEEQAAAKAELELKFKRGEISTAEFLEQSGAVDEYLSKRGVPIDALKAAVDRNQESTEQQSWETATQKFLNSPAGADWPGGYKNLELIGMIISSQPTLLNADDKVAALAQAYNFMKTKGTIFPNTPALEPAPAPVVPVPVVATASAAIPGAPPAAPAAPRAAATSSSLFGRSSGSGATTEVAPTAAAAAKVDIPADASPAEILEAWKKGQVAQGKDPNAAFQETFSARRV